MVTTPSSPPRPATRRVPPGFVFEDDSAPLTPAVLPSNHFLAQRPVTPPRPEESTAAQEGIWTDRARPDTSSLAAADFDVSVVSGFMPPEEPVQTLRGVGSGWDALEDALEAVQREAELIPGGGVGKLSEQWRASVRAVRRAPTVDAGTHR